MESTPSIASRFKQRLIANIATINLDDTLPDTPFDESLYNAFIAVQHSYPIQSSTIWRFVCYLKGTSKKGIIVKPSSLCNLDCFVDANFAGSWTQPTSENPSSVKSRTGYVITFVSCPVLFMNFLLPLS